MNQYVSHLALPEVTLLAKSDADFPVFTKERTISLLIDPEDSATVHVAAELFASDVARLATSHNKPEMLKSLPPSASHLIVAGTPGSIFIRQLAESGKISLDPLKNGWEQYLLQIVEKPFPNIERAFIIAGSDRRGTAYGLLGISEAMGVSPFEWWTDIPIVPKESMYLQTNYMVTKAPSVRYRGIFINDEDWGLIPWASKKCDPEYGNIGPKTYQRVCELLLRLGANMLAPAMHACSDTFFSHPESFDVLDRYGIILTTSHCEPLLFNNVSEWTREKNGEWNYLTNSDSIMQELAKRVKATRGRECVYPLAMRGIHDSGMVGIPREQQSKLTEKALHDQRDILARELQTQPESVPQVFVPYKEVMELYEEGLEVPDDVTIVWADDNYGYLKRVAKPEERKRSGSFGVYYHVSYLGSPHDYIWLATTHPSLIYEEMNKAYITGADRYWLLNVGDIKPQEMQMRFFLDFARDVTAFSQERAASYPVEFFSGIFGEKYVQELKSITAQYYTLAFGRKPEMMGGGMDWNEAHWDEILWDTGFSFENFGEAQNRLASYKKLVDETDALYDKIPADLQPAFDELLLYQIRQSSNLNETMLYAELSRIYARQQNPFANSAAELAAHAHKQIQKESNRIHTILNGKWDGIFSIPVVTEMPPNYSNMPPVGHFPDELCNFYFEKDKYVSIECGKWHRAFECNPEIKICKVDFLSPFGSSVQFRAHPDVKPGNRYSDLAQTTRVEYDFITSSSGHARLTAYALPTLPYHPGWPQLFAVSIDDLFAQWLYGVDHEYSATWNDAVMRNSVVCHAPMNFPILEPGKHTLKVYCMTPGMVIQKIVISFGEIPESYLGPEFTRCNE